MAGVECYLCLGLSRLWTRMKNGCLINLIHTLKPDDWGNISTKIYKWVTSSFFEDCHITNFPLESLSMQGAQAENYCVTAFCLVQHSVMTNMLVLDVIFNRVNCLPINTLMHWECLFNRSQSYSPWRFDCHKTEEMASFKVIFSICIILLMSKFFR